MAVINQVQKTSEDAIRISYTDKDYVNILNDLINSIPAITQKWNTTDVNDPRYDFSKINGYNWGYVIFYSRYAGFRSLP